MSLVWKECTCALPRELGSLAAGETKSVGDTQYHRQPRTNKVFMLGPPCGCKHANGSSSSSSSTTTNGTSSRSGDPTTSTTTSTTLGPRGAWSPYKGSALPMGLGELAAGGEPKRFGRHWWYKQPKSGRVMTLGFGDAPEDCDATEIFDPISETCVKVHPIHEACAPGYSWTQEHGCVKDPSPPPQPPINPPPMPTCASDETFNPQTGRCEKTPPAAPATPAKSYTGLIVGGVAVLGALAIGAALVMKPKSKAIHRAAEANAREAAVYEERSKQLRAAARNAEARERQEQRERARRAA